VTLTLGWGRKIWTVKGLASNSEKGEEILERKTFPLGEAILQLKAGDEVGGKGQLFTYACLRWVSWGGHCRRGVSGNLLKLRDG